MGAVVEGGRDDLAGAPGGGRERCGVPHQREAAGAGNRYLVLGLGAGQAADLAVPPDRGDLIAYGPLLSDDGAA